MPLCLRDDMLAALPFERQMECCRLHGRSARHAARLQRARNAVAEMLRLAPRAYVSVSWGKDSICLAHLVYQVAPDLPMYFLRSTETEWMHDVDAVIASFLARWAIRFHTVTTDHFRADRYASWQASRDAGQCDLQRMVRRDNYDGCFLGLTRYESDIRALALARGGNAPGLPREIYRYGGAPPYYRCCPLADWELLDVGAYIAAYDLPLLRLYRESGLHERTTARATRKCAENNGLAAIKRTTMDGWNRLIGEYPELSIYA